jgi:hypothetical protein
MAIYYTSLAAAILLGIAGQIALKMAANGSATVVAQFLNPLTIIDLGVYIVAALCSRSPSPRSRRVMRSSRWSHMSFGTSLSAGRRWPG